MAACRLLIFPAARRSGQGPTLCSRCPWTHSVLGLIQLWRIFEAPAGMSPRRRSASHPVAFEHLLAGRTEARALALKTLLHGVVIAEILAAEARCIARARALLLLGSHMLGLRDSVSAEQYCQTNNNRQRTHGCPPGRIKDTQHGAMAMVP